jgi:hypothetical protein
VFHEVLRVKSETGTQVIPDEQIIDKLLLVLEKANIAEKAKLCSMALSASSKSQHDLILDIAAHFFKEPSELNDELLKTLQSDELVPIATLFYRLKPTNSLKTFDTMLHSKNFKDSD